MDANERAEDARAAREAVEAVAGRGTSGRTTAVEQALRRYLEAEAVHEARVLRREDEQARDEKTGGEKSTPT